MSIRKWNHVQTDNGEIYLQVGKMSSGSKINSPWTIGSNYVTKLGK